MVYVHSSLQGRTSIAIRRGVNLGEGSSKGIPREEAGHDTLIITKTVHKLLEEISDVKAIAG